MASQKTKKNQLQQRNLLIAGGVVVVLCIVALASMFGYSLRAAVYSSRSAAVSVSPTPHVTPSPSCLPLTTAQVLNIQDHIRQIQKQISDTDAQIVADQKNQMMLDISLQKLKEQLKKSKDKNTVVFLKTQITTVSGQIESLDSSIQALRKHDEQLYQQITDLNETLGRNCRTQGSPTPI